MATQDATTCRLCLMKCKSQTVLSSHITKHFIVDSYTCEQCEVLFSSYDLLQEHFVHSGHTTATRQDGSVFGQKFAEFLNVAGHYADDDDLLAIFKRALNSAPSYPPALVAEVEDSSVESVSTEEDALADSAAPATDNVHNKRMSTGRKRKRRRSTFQFGEKKLYHRRNAWHVCKHCNGFESRWLHSLQRHLRAVHKMPAGVCGDGVDYVLKKDVGRHKDDTTDDEEDEDSDGQVEASRVTKTTILSPSTVTSPLQAEKAVPGGRLRKTRLAPATTGLRSAQCQLCNKVVVWSCRSKHAWVHVASEGHKVAECSYCGLSGAQLDCHLIRLHGIKRTAQGTDYISYKNELQNEFEAMMKRCYSDESH